MRLQRCQTCDTTLYPPRDVCAVCLSDRLVWDEMDAAEGEVMAEASVHHSHEPRFRDALPLRIGLVKLSAGPVAVCFLGACRAGERVLVTAAADAEGHDILTANRMEA
jgi:uncharacterized OB-fold protein